MRFLVGVLAISAQRQRYYRFFTGTITRKYPPAIQPWKDPNQKISPRGFTAPLHGYYPVEIERFFVYN